MLDDKDKVNGLVHSYKYIVGLNLDHKIRKYTNIIPDPLFGIKESVEISIRTRLYATRASISPNIDGYTINFSVGVSGFANLIKLKD